VIVGVVSGLLLHVHRFNRSILGWLALLGTLVLPIAGVAAVIIHYSGQVPKKELANARHAEDGAKLVLQSFVYPILESPIPRVLPDDPEAAEKAITKLQEAVTRLSDSLAEITTYLDRVKRNLGPIASLTWNAQDQATSDEIIYEVELYSMINLYLKIERE